MVVTALSRLARSVPDAHELLNGLAGGEVTLASAKISTRHRCPSPTPLVEVLALTAQLQTGLDSRRTRVGLAAARIRGQLRARPPKLNHRQEHHNVGLYWTGRSRSVSCSPSPPHPSTAPSGEPTAPLTQMPLTTQVSQPRDAAKIEKSVVVLKEETRGGTSVGRRRRGRQSPTGRPADR